MNFVAGKTLANRVVVPVGSDGTVKIFNSTGRTNVVVDVSGWYLATRPTASDINFTAGQSVPNLVLVRLPADGRLKLFNSVGTTNVVVDVQGGYAGS